MKKNSIWIASWILIAILFSSAYKYFSYLIFINNSPSNYTRLFSWRKSLKAIIDVPTIGFMGGGIFLIIDHFTLREKTKKREFFFLLE